MPERIVFVLSTSRTGTKTLATGLTNGQVLSPHQPPFSRLLTVLSNYYLHGWLPKGLLEWLVRQIREPQIARANCRYYVQVYSLDYLPARMISRRRSKVYILHLVRDPRTFVPSYLNWMHSRFRSLIANKLVIGWHPSGFFTGEFSWGHWRSLDAFQRVCWHWVYKNALIESLFKSQKGYKRLRFEDLFSGNGVAVLKEFLSYCGIPYRDEMARMLFQKRNVSRRRTFPPWEQWNPERRQQLMDICGKQMNRYGYG